MGTAILLGLAGGSSLILGALLVFITRLQGKMIGLTMAFESGALISAVAYGLILEAVEKEGGWLIALGLAAGALTFYTGGLLIDRYGGEDRKKSGGEQLKGSPLAIGLGSLLDSVPESFVVGLSLVEGTASFAVVFAIFIANLAESISGTSGFEKAGWKRSRTMELWLGIFVASGLVAGFGFALFANFPGLTGALAEAFASGAVLVVLADTMMPEAFELGRKSAGLFTVLGFKLLAALSLM